MNAPELADRIFELTKDVDSDVVADALDLVAQKYFSEVRLELNRLALIAIQSQSS